ncbi:MAG: glycosyltransferase [Bacteroidetes bacterium]|nr:glycosyltransferase [Bacteroidota bacterium]
MASTESRPLRIVAAVEWYPPAYKAGGPIRSVHNLMSLLRDQTPHRLEVVCGAYDIHSNTVMEGITPNEMHHHDGIAVTYLTRDRWTSHMWRDILTGSPNQPAPDILYLNSLFSVPFALTPLRVARSLGVKVVLAPRGMLGAGALAIKPRKKKVFLKAARVLGWFRDVRWHASTAVEAADIHQAFPGSQVVVASNAPIARSTEVKTIDVSADLPLRLIMLGRVHRIKNLHFALKALSSASLPPQGVVVELVGPAEDEEYLTHLMSLARPGLTLEFTGPVPPHELASVWMRGHALLMPTTHENFGHAVVEAWAHGRPVLLSDKTPWRDLATAQLGWELPLEESAWIRGLEEVFGWDAATWRSMSEACVERHRQLVEDPGLVAANRALFEN